jgi:hypothetical protein
MKSSNNSVKKRYFATNPFCMKRTFHIMPPDSGDTADPVLLCELSQHHVCLALADGTLKNIGQLSYYELRNGLEPEKLRQLLKAENLDFSLIKRVVISNAFKEVVLVPAHHFSKENARRFYTTTYGNTAETFFFDDLANENAVLVHVVPQAIMGILKSARGTEIKHSYTCWLKNGNDLNEENGIAVHFTNKEIGVMVKKEHQLKLMQSYYYTAPLDVVYYLLAICREYSLSQTGIALMLSGLVSEDSAMYTELHQYFSNIRFWEPSVTLPVHSDHPHHYFSSMYNLASCAL